MNRSTVSGGSSLAGVALLATCTCTLSRVGLGAVAVGGASAATFNLQMGFVLFAVALILGGLFARSRKAFWVALAGFGILGVGYLLAPPSIMTEGARPYALGQLLGLGLYPVAATLIVLAFLNGFRSPKPEAAATSMGGMAVASGCSCCMVNGALNGIGATAGVGLTGATVFFGGMGLVAAGLAWLGSVRAAGLAVVGAMVAWGAPQITNLVLAEAIRPPFSVATRFLGLAIVMGAFAMAYQTARRRSQEEPTPAAREAALGVATPG